MNLEKSCRFFRIITNHPNCLYSLNMILRNLTGFRFDHIKHLMLCTELCDKISIKETLKHIMINSNWYNSVNEITFLSTHNRYKSTPIDLKRLLLSNKNMINCDNIGALNVKCQINDHDVSFCKLILYSFPNIEYLTINDEFNIYNSGFDKNELNVDEMTIFRKLKRFKYIKNRNHNESIWLLFANYLINTNNICFKKPIDFIVDNQQCLQIQGFDHMHFQKIAVMFASLNQFDTIYFTIQCDELSVIDQCLSKLLQYLSFKQNKKSKKHCIHLKIVMTVSREQQLKEETFEFNRLLFPKATNMNAIQIHIELEYITATSSICTVSQRRLYKYFKSYFGYLNINGDDLKLIKNHSFKVLTKKLDDNNDKLIFECDNISAFKWDELELDKQQICKNGIVYIYYNSIQQIATLRVIDKNDNNKIKLLQYIDGFVPAQMDNPDIIEFESDDRESKVMKCVAWNGNDNMNPTNCWWELEFWDERQAKQFEMRRPTNSISVDDDICNQDTQNVHRQISTHL